MNYLPLRYAGTTRSISLQASSLPQLKSIKSTRCPLFFHKRHLSRSQQSTITQFQRRAFASISPSSTPSNSRSTHSLRSLDTLSLTSRPPNYLLSQSAPSNPSYHSTANNYRNPQIRPQSPPHTPSLRSYSSTPPHQPIQPQLTPQNPQTHSHQPKTQIAYSYASTPFENPRSYSRSTKNLPDEYITPLAETPDESYTILNELQSHPIRYRSWNTFLRPEYRPTTNTQTSNDYVPQSVKFEAAKQETIDPWDNIFVAIENGGFFFRGVGTALANAGTENMAKFGLLMTLVLLYAQYSTGTFWTFDYDRWIDGHFRALLIMIDKQFNIGDRIEKMEKEWDSFEYEQIQEESLPKSQQSWIARVYFWCRDGLFSESAREHSNWKLRKHQQDDALKLANVRDELYMTNVNINIDTNTATAPPMSHLNGSNGPPLTRHQQRDQELIQVDQLRLKMVQDNRGMALNKTQEYILRSEFKRIAREYADLEQEMWSGAEKPPGFAGMDDTEIDLFLHEQAEKDRELSRSPSSSSSSSSSINTRYQRREIRESVDLAIQEQQRREDRIDSLARSAQQKRYDYELNNNQLADDPIQSQNHLSKPHPTAPGFFDKLTALFSPASKPTPPPLPQSQANFESQFHTGNERNDKDGHISAAAALARDQYAFEMMRREDERARQSLLKPEGQSSPLKDNIYGQMAPSRRVMNEIQSERMKNLQSAPFQDALLHQQQFQNTSDTFEKATTPTNPFSWLASRDQEQQLLEQTQFPTSSSTSSTSSTLHSLESQFHSHSREPAFDGRTLPYDPQHNQQSAQVIRQQQIDDDKHAARIKGGLFGSLFGK